MTDHLTDDDLILHFYGEGGRDDEARVDGHLQSCPTCQAAWTELTATLQLVDTAAIPEPDPGFERTMWARVQPQLPERNEPARRLTFFDKRRPAPFFALAAAAAILLVAGYVWFARQQPAQQAPRAVERVPVPVSVSPGDTRERALLTALNTHFDQTEMLLVELMNAPDTNAIDIDFERQTADDLVASGRLYRVTAEQNGDVRLAELLDDLESVLVEVARGPQRLNRADVSRLRAHIDSANLLFKVRAVSNQIQERQKKFSTE